VVAYQVDDVSGGERDDIGAGDHAGALLLDGGLGSVDGVEAVAGEGHVVGRVLLGVVVGGRDQDRGVTTLSCVNESQPSFSPGCYSGDAELKK
jgi:hypothetical protein